MKYKYNCIDEKEILDIYKNDEYFDSWYKIVRKILHSREFQKRRLFKHHEFESVWHHSIIVSFESYKYALKKGFNAYDCAIAGLLHDFYTRVWQDGIEMSILEDKYRERFIHPKKVPLFKKHAFTHPVEALKNSKTYFKKYLNKDIENAIVTHMFPLSLFNKVKLPNNATSFVITYIDKKVSMNVIGSVKGVLKYTGLANMKKELN